MGVPVRSDSRFNFDTEPSSRLRGDSGIFWSSSPEMALLLLAVSGLITLVILIANWHAATNALFNGDGVNPETGCPWGYEAVDRFTCAATGWWTFGRWVGVFFLVNLALFVWAIFRGISASNRSR